MLGKVDGHLLPGAIDRGVIKHNGERQPKTVMRFKPRPLIAGSVALAHFDRSFDTNEFFGYGLLFDASRLVNKLVLDATDPLSKETDFKKTAVKIMPA